MIRRRAGRAAAALSVVASAAFGPTGPALAVGTVTEARPVASVSGVLLGPYSAAEVADPTAVAAPTAAAAGPTAAADGTTPAVSPAAPDGTGIPSTVLAAYKSAEAALAASNPGCRLPWNLLAGIGRVESGHASGGRVDGAGTTNGRILGPRLDGTMVGTATIRDTDGGTLDGDAAFDRAVGPMQFIPGTWRSFAKDGNNDTVASPHNVFDAALAAGTYLCAGGGDLSQPAAQRAALLRYNRSDAYGALVLRWAAAYGAGVAVLPDGTGQVPATTPTPPAQVPAPANTTLDPAAAAALAAPAPAVTGPAASESDAGAVVAAITVTSTTPTTPTTSTPTPTTPTTSTPTSTSPTTSTPASSSTTPTSSATTRAPVTTTTGTTGATSTGTSSTSTTTPGTASTTTSRTTTSRTTTSQTTTSQTTTSQTTTQTTAQTEKTSTGSEPEPVVTSSGGTGDSGDSEDPTAAEARSSVVTPEEDTAEEPAD